MNTSSCDIIEQLRRALSESGTRIYMPMPTIPASAFTMTQNSIYDRRRAYMRPESQEKGEGDLFIDVELRICEFKDTTTYPYPGVIISLCKGCGSGWSTLDSVTLNPKDPANHGIFRGHKAAATFCHACKNYTVYFC